MDFANLRVPIQRTRVFVSAGANIRFRSKEGNVKLENGRELIMLYKRCKLNRRGFIKYKLVLCVYLLHLRLIRTIRLIIILSKKYVTIAQ